MLTYEITTGWLAHSNMCMHVRNPLPFSLSLSLSLSPPSWEPTVSPPSESLHLWAAFPNDLCIPLITNMQCILSNNRAIIVSSVLSPIFFNSFYKLVNINYVFQISYQIHNWMFTKCIKYKNSTKYYQILNSTNSSKIKKKCNRNVSGPHFSH